MLRKEDSQLFLLLTNELHSYPKPNRSSKWANHIFTLYKKLYKKWKNCESKNTWQKLFVVRSKIFKFLALLFVGCYICIHFLLQLGPGGGFGPVSDTGYGISYMIAGNKKIFFHISSKRSAQITDSTRFMDLLFETLCDMKSLFE